MKKNKIVMLGHKTIPSRLGGVEIVVEELASRLVEMGNEVTCLNRSVDSASNVIKGDNYYKGIKIVTIPTIKIKGLSAFSSSFFGSFVAAFGNYDIVHFHAEGPAFMCWLPKMFNKKIIVTIHGLDHKRKKWGKFASWYIKQGEKNAVKYADKIIVLSNSDKQYFINEYNRETFLINNGVNKPTNCEPDIIEKKYGLKKNEYILYLGRIVPEKNVDLLLDAYNDIKTEKKLVIAGGSSDTSSYYNEIKKKALLNRNIIVTGFVEGKELEELYSNAYAYCLPSNLEGMPLSLLEAMSYGNCCIISDLEVCKEVIDKYGVVFNRNNKTDLEEKLKYICNNKDFVDYCKSNSSSYICNKYSWDSMVIKTLELYNS